MNEIDYAHKLVPLDMDISRTDFNHQNHKDVVVQDQHYLCFIDNKVDARWYCGYFKFNSSDYGLPLPKPTKQIVSLPKNFFVTPRTKRFIEKPKIQNSVKRRSKIIFFFFKRFIIIFFLQKI